MIRGPQLRTACRPQLMLALTVAMIGCDSAPDKTRQVPLSGPIWTTDEAWTVRPEPDLVLGLPDSEPEVYFHDIRGAVGLSDDRIVVAEASFDELLLFSEDGRFLKTIGRSGRGPGEFSDPNDLFLLEGDSIAVRDLATARITLFTADGSLVSTWRIGGPLRAIAGVLQGHRLVVYRDLPGLGTGVVQGPPFHVYIVDFDGKEVASVGPFEGARVYNVDRGNFHMGVEFPFDHRTHVAAGWDRFAVGNSWADSVMIYDPAAHLVLVLHMPHESRPVRRADVDAYIERRAPPSDNRLDQQWRAAHFEMLDHVSVPETLPAFADLRFDPDGNLWVREYPEPNALQHTWCVFDTLGRWLGDVSLPGDLNRVLHIGRSRIIGRTRGEYDIPLVAVYRLEKY